MHLQPVAILLLAAALAVSPMLTPSALAYDANANRPDSTARFILPDFKTDGACLPVPVLLAMQSGNDGGNESMSYPCQSLKRQLSDMMAMAAAICGAGAVAGGAAGQVLKKRAGLPGFIATLLCAQLGTGIAALQMRANSVCSTANAFLDHVSHALKREVL